MKEKSYKLKSLTPANKPDVRVLICFYGSAKVGTIRLVALSAEEKHPALYTYLNWR